jgi:hypothetical protein
MLIEVLASCIEFERETPNVMEKNSKPSGRRMQLGFGCRWYRVPVKNSGSADHGWSANDHGQIRFFSHG